MDSLDLKECLSLAHGDENQRGKWLYFHELRTGKGAKGGRKGYIDGYAIALLPCFDHHAIAYEVKVSRSDFFVDVKNYEKQNLLYFIRTNSILLHLLA